MYYFAAPLLITFSRVILSCSLMADLQAAITAALYLPTVKIKGIVCNKLYIVHAQ